MTAKIHFLSRAAESGFVTVDGYLVPHVKVFRIKGGANDGAMSLSIDKPGCVNLTMDVDDDESLPGLLVFLANAMAVAAGYTSHGANARRANPYAVQCHFITGADEDGTMQVKPPE